MKKLFIIFMFAGCFMLMAGCKKSDAAILEKVLADIEMPSEVTGDLLLQTEYIYKGKIVTAAWHSTASDIITDSGKVSTDVIDQRVILNLKLSLGNDYVVKNYSLTVKGSEDLALIYTFLYNQLQIAPQTDEDLELLSEYTLDGKTINALWSSDNEHVLSPEGIICRGDIDILTHLTVVLSRNEAEVTKTFPVTVLRDFNLTPIAWWHTAPVWSGAVPGEAAKPAPQSCFAGAVYRKVHSSKDWWLGIESIVTLPEFIPDERRHDDTKLSYYLDNASLYLGGNAGKESDVGLTWSIGYPDRNSAVYSRFGIAYRPFWRYITSANKNIYENANVADLEYYYFPGDKLRISVITPEPGFMQMRIELLEETTMETYADIRAGFQLGPDYRRVFVSPVFPSPGMGISKAEFKRVNAIDQVGNEGKATLNTNAKASGAVWHEVYLYRRINDGIYKVPFNGERAAYMACPSGQNQNGDFKDAVIVDTDGVDGALGGERVTLDPKNGTGKLYNNTLFMEKKKEEEL